MVAGNTDILRVVYLEIYVDAILTASDVEYWHLTIHAGELYVYHGSITDEGRTSLLPEMFCVEVRGERREVAFLGPASMLVAPIDSMHWMGKALQRASPKGRCHFDVKSSAVITTIDYIDLSIRSSIQEITTCLPSLPPTLPAMTSTSRRFSGTGPVQ